MKRGATFICRSCQRETVSTGTTQYYCKDCVKTRKRERNRDKDLRRYYQQNTEERKEAARRKREATKRTQKLLNAVKFAKESGQTYGKAFAPVVTVVIPPEFAGG